MNKIKLTAKSIPSINTTKDGDLEIELDNVTNLDLCKIDQSILIKTFCEYGKSEELFNELIQQNDDMLVKYFTKNINELRYLCDNLGVKYDK